MTPPSAMLPVHRDPNLIVTEAAMQYQPPAHQMKCPTCGRGQVFQLSQERYLSIRPEPTTPLLADPTEVPERPDEPPEPVLFKAPPGWGLVICHYCSATLVLVLCRWPSVGLINPPALIEVSTVRLNYSTVQYRLPDDTQSGKERWRLAFVHRQHNRQELDLAVNLHQDDPEYHGALVRTLKAVEVRLPDHDGAQRWRTALVSRVRNERLLNLTVHYDESDPEAKTKGFDRLESVRGDEVGQWRYPAVAFVIQLAVTNAKRGERHSCWLPINNT